MATNQAYLFLVFTINGIIIGLLFDIFRILRKSFKTSDIITYLQDILFWILTGLILLYSIFTFSNGEIRFYMFLGVFFGCLIYMLVFSKYFIEINVKIILIFKKIIEKTVSIIIFPFKIIIKFLKKILYKPLKSITTNIKRIKINHQKNIKNIFKTQKNIFFSKNKKDFWIKCRKIYYM